MLSTYGSGLAFYQADSAGRSGWHGCCINVKPVAYSEHILEKTMKRTMLVAVLMGSGLVSQAALAQADLAKAKNCMACHAIGSKLVGPAYKDVAAKYAGDKGAEGRLVAKVMKGGSGVWGAIPMPANPQVSEAEAHTLVKWVLSQK